MNKELALRTFAYLNRHYKTHNATIINKQEIEAIEFILNDNEFLEQQCKKQKEAIDKINSLLGIAYGGNEDYYIEKINKINEILKEVSE